MRVAARSGSREADADRGDLALHLIAGGDQAADVVIDLVGVEEFARLLGHPGAGFDADNFEPGARQRQHGDAARGAQPDDDHIHRFEVDGHGSGF